MKVFNYTPHVITVVTGAEYCPEIRKYVRTENTMIVTSIESSGMLNARMTTIDADPINGIPAFEKAITGCDMLPEDIGDDDIVVVSALYATAYARVYGTDSRLYTVADPVYDREGGMRVCGCRGICKAF